MTDNPAIKAVRDARRAISASFDHDPKKLVEHYIKLQKRHADRLLSKKMETLFEKDETAA